ncbi:MAG: hypothetical protein A2092_15475 [Rhodobacteraceae bacterium GWE1_64_9]|nr:MAG: hypothetical protein A2092_15475 [Rhodobacteraceae bacterium GWE1_64_9]OHC47279.1 MAG: hypothetical protein A2X69_19835 [Rhodobacteraceae bacterium GWF1_65_7]HBD91545.1 hypothetical protein [Gemmobacter sp.]HBU13668.1 hypothetical protein [Gemmobacter sp.]
MNRRLILAAPGLLAAPLIARASHADAEFLHHYRAWGQAKRDWYSLCDAPGHEYWDTPECQDANRREYAAFDAMMAIRARTMDGIAALAHVIWDASGPAFSRNWPGYDEEANCPENQPKIALWQSATGRDDHPPLFREK